MPRIRQEGKRFGGLAAGCFAAATVYGFGIVMNKGYAFGFLIVLLVVVLGLYVAFTGFMSSREALRAQATSPAPTEPVQTTEVVQATELPDEPTPTPTGASLVLPTPLPGITVTLTAAVLPDETEAPPETASTEPPPPSPTSPPPAQPTDTPPSLVQPPTVAPPSPEYQFRLGGPPGGDPAYPNCCYIFGTVRNAAGSPLEGVAVKAFNEWNDLPPAITKGGGEAGQYNIPIGHDAVTWYVVVVDATGTPISTQVPVNFDLDAAGGYRVDWQRTY